MTYTEQFNALRLEWSRLNLFHQRQIQRFTIATLLEVMRECEDISTRREAYGVLMSMLSGKPAFGEWNVNDFQLWRETLWDL